MTSNEIVILIIVDTLCGVTLGASIAWCAVRRRIERVRESIITAQVDITKDQLPVGIWIPLTHIADMPQVAFNELMDWLPPETQRRVMNGGIRPKGT